MKRFKFTYTIVEVSTVDAENFEQAYKQLQKEQGEGIAQNIIDIEIEEEANV